MKNVLTPARGALLAAMLVGAGVTAEAQLRSALDVGERATRSAEQAQARINQLDDERSDLVREFRTIVQRKDAATLNARQLEQTVNSQVREIASLEDQLGRVDEITAVMVPMMLDMIDDLEAFVEADLPFQITERRARIQRLKDVMTRADVVPAEKYRQIIVAYTTELEAGNTVDTWTQEVEIDGLPTDVDMFRYGRIALVYLSPDNRHAARWDRNSRSWVDLEAAYRPQIRTAIRAADELIQPEILWGPVAPLTVTAPAAAAAETLAPEAEEFKSVMLQTANLGIFAEQQELIIQNQENQIALLEERIATREERDLEVRPLLERMVSDLKFFVEEVDLPFKVNERKERIQKLEAALARSKEELPVADLTNLILTAYKEELAYGTSAREVWNEQVNFGNGSVEVRMFRYGRAALVTLSLDRSEAHRFDRETRSFVPVSSGMRTEIAKAIKIAEGRAQETVLYAPLVITSAENLQQ